MYLSIYLSSENRSENSKLAQSLLQKQPSKVMYFNVFSQSDNGNPF